VSDELVFVKSLHAFYALKSVLNYQSLHVYRWY